MSTSEEIAWAAGLFEGEGCFTVQRSRRTLVDGTDVVYKAAVARIHMTDRDVVERFYKIVGVGQFWSAGYRRGGLGTKPAYEWHVTTLKGFKTVFFMLAPYLGERRTARGLEVIIEVERAKEVRNAKQSKIA